MTALTHGPLAGVRIIEIAGIGPLPFAGMLLADLGAGILRIDPPRPRELQSADTDGRDPVMRGRAAMTLDLKTDEGRDRLLGLVAVADVLIEGLRPGKMEALGLGPDACFARAPHLVYGRSTGWGQTGSLAASAGHDPNYVSYTGALSWLGASGRPAMPPFGLVGDTAGGALYLVIGVLAALHHARATGTGQVVDAAIMDGTLSLMTGLYAMQDRDPAERARWHTTMGGSCPFATLYETADGGFMAICALESRFYAQFVEGLGLDTKALPPRGDMAHWPALREQFARSFRAKPRSHWEQIFAGTDACVTPALSIEEARDHPINAARGAFANGIPAAAPRFSVTATGHAPQGLAADAMIERWQTGSG